MFRTQTRGFALARPIARRFRTSTFSFEPELGAGRGAGKAFPDPAAPLQPDDPFAWIDDGDHPLMTPMPPV